MFLPRFVEQRASRIPTCPTCGAGQESEGAQSPTAHPRRKRSLPGSRLFSSELYVHVTSHNLLTLPQESPYCQHPVRECRHGLQPKDFLGMIPRCDKGRKYRSDGLLSGPLLCQNLQQLPLPPRRRLITQAGLLMAALPETPAPPTTPLSADPTARSCFCFCQRDSSFSPSPQASAANVQLHHLLYLCRTNSGFRFHCHTISFPLHLHACAPTPAMRRYEWSRAMQPIGGEHGQPGLLGPRLSPCLSLSVIPTPNPSELPLVGSSSVPDASSPSGFSTTCEKPASSTTLPSHFLGQSSNT
ncbi:hypothetical protein B0I35DRAFT_220460 [Stachybotrys elegans]|uniref:Uncharacterized protein n=1 Tax=Stachybotrys elegans TaxID=80388 RepID=A0A8K0SXJ3_9HYPO|nr:hypothetical protein B0I35DRAFT_220460 [Stachybotrys elegans]